MKRALVFSSLKSSPKGCPKGCPKGRPSGFALVAVLWMLVLISALAVGVATTSHTETRLAANVVAVAQARHLADGGVHHAAKHLFETNDRLARCLDGRPFTTLTLDDVPVVISVQDEAGKIDLNQAPRPLLIGLFVAAGSDPRPAMALADAVLDWRDSDHTARAQGAEDSDYRAAGLAHGAKDAAFESIFELLSVKGMTPALFDVLRHDITVNSRVPTIDPKSASSLALAAVPGFDEQIAQQYTELRARMVDCLRLPPPPPNPVSAPYLNPSPSISFTLVADARRNGARFQREAVLVFTYRRDDPIRIVGWRVATDSAVATTGETK